MKVLILSLILCWGLYASAETKLREEAANTDELPVALEGVHDNGPEEQLASREEDDLPGDEAKDKLGPPVDNELSTDEDATLTASDRWWCNKKCRRRKRRRRARKWARRARRAAECRRQESLGNPKHWTCRKHYAYLERRRRKKCPRGLGNYRCWYVSYRTCTYGCQCSVFGNTACSKG